MGELSENKWQIVFYHGTNFEFGQFYVTTDFIVENDIQSILGYLVR